MIYLDNAATTKMLPEHIEFLKQANCLHFANSSSSHRLGKEQGKLIDQSRKELLSMLNVSIHHYNAVFCSSASEANNLIINHYKNQQVLFSYSCHKSITATVSNLCENIIEYKVKNNNLIDLEDLETQLNSETALVIITTVNSQTGTIQDVEKICQTIKEISPTTHIHLDHVQGFLKTFSRLDKIDFDSMSLAAHKVHGPKGVGCLVYKKDLNLRPLIYGGGQESGLRSSTVASPLIYTFLACVKDLKPKYQNTVTIEYITKLNLSVERAFKDAFSKSYRINEIDYSSPYILMLVIPEVPSDVLLRHFEQFEIYMSSTSACSSKDKSVNEVFKAIGLDTKHHKNVLRVSFSLHSKEEEIRELENKLKQIKEEISFLL